MKTALLINLNKEQKEAVEALDGPLLITAGPGTGKTHLLSARAASIMREKNIPGENILILTYTNAAAKSVKERLAKIVGFEGYKVTAETFHGFANSVILDSEEASAYIKERIQMTDLEKIKSLEYIVDNCTDSVKELRPFGYPYLYIFEIARRISELKNEGITPSDFEKMLQNVKPDGIYVEKKHMPRLAEFSFIYKKYEELKGGRNKNVFDERGRYDYDDMIIIAIKILAEEQELKKAYQKRYRYIMVDEFQDTNGAQLKLLFSLCEGKNPNLCCVGDDDQSIYRFQGASIANFRLLKERFPRIKVIKLKNNYRSTKEIIDLSSSIIKQIPSKERLDEQKELIPQKRYKKRNVEFLQFTTEDEEIMCITRKIREIANSIKTSKELEAEERKRPYNQIAILVRKRSFILKLIDNFLKTGIPYATDGKEDISCQRRARQMIDVLKLARTATYDLEEKDLVLYGVLSCDFFEIAQGDILKFINFANKRDKKTPSSILTEFIGSFHVDRLDKKPSLSDTKKLPFLKKLTLGEANKMHLASWAIQRLLGDADTRPVHDLLMGFVEDVNLYKFIITEYEKNKILITRELRALTSFINMVKNSSLARPDLVLTEFLDELETMKTHNMPIAGQLVTATQDGVRIITAHASKGLEFHTCIIPFCVQDKSWPLKPLPDRIPIPPSILKAKEKVGTKSEFARLSFFDETRLFYVAASRTKSNLIFTSSPSEDTVASSFFNNMSIGLKDNEDTEENILKEFFKKGGGEDPLKNTEDALRDLVKNLVLTPTKLNNFLRCKRKFLYDNLLLLPGKKKQSLVFGNCTHKALEDTYRKYKNENKFPDFGFFKASFERELRFQGVNKTIANWCLAKLGELKVWFKKTRANPVPPIDLEKKKIVTLKGGIIFSGKFDKVEFENEKKKLIRIIDYKTGKPDDHLKKLENESDLKSEKCDNYLRQLVAYKMLYERDTYEPAKYKASHGVLVFLEPIKKTSLKYSLTKGDYIDKKVPITNEMVDELEEVICGAWKEINKLRFDKLPERDPEKCNNCAFNSICWE